MISVRGLSKRYGATTALDSVDFDVSQGAIVGLLGPNGAGKTTCMRILSGYLHPTAGEASVARIDLRKDSVAARRQTGYLSEGAPLYTDMRVEEYLRFRGRLRSIPRARLRDEVRRVIDLCALGTVRSRLAGQLSRGYRQRVGLAAALLGSPSVLILDEPTAGLDPNQMREFRTLLGSMTGEQTILLSTHILSEVAEICGQVVIVDRGRVVMQGAIDDVCAVHDVEVVTLEIRGPTDVVAERLGALDFVQSVEVTSAVDDAEIASCRIVGRFDGPALEQLSQTVATAGWILRELRRERGQLSELFSKLTAGEGKGE
jgi:ABC-2 type transport system ATP-binding protein